jgi:hypothetical protein
MCIYCGTTKYRKIYEAHNGSIPKDHTGRRYHIHHIDGDRNNNQIRNLVALSIQDHYQIHLTQGDWAACIKLAGQMSWSHEEISKLCQTAAKTHGYKPPSQKGKRYWNNGLTNRMSAECPGTDWILGKLLYCDRDELGKRMSAIKKLEMTDNKRELLRSKSLNNGSRPPNQTGKRVWNNGVKQTMTVKCPEGYVAGFLPR